MPIPKAAHPVTCDLCGITVNPIMGRYLFLSAGWRGRPTRRPLDSVPVAFCGPCGDRLLQLIRPLLAPTHRARLYV